MTSHSTNFPICSSCNINNCDNICQFCKENTCVSNKCSINFPHKNKTNFVICSTCNIIISRKFKPLENDHEKYSKNITINNIYILPNKIENYPVIDNIKYNLLY